jgi:arylsulfatase A-like enzyme
MDEMPEVGLHLLADERADPLPSKPGADAPNVVVIVLDDTGFAQLGPFGSDIATPNIDRLADSGVRYNRFHVTSLCSPTRASLLTGRNHHAVGVGFLVDLPMDYPGYSTRIPKSSATLPRVLKDAGYNTMAVGKWHLVPRGERSAAGPFDRWPLGYGFERYYGFLRGDANHWAPELVSDNHYIEPPARPEDGYHLSEDLADQAIKMVLDQKHSAEEKPFFLYWALGAMHAPHHVAEEWVEPYRGMFDDGWDRWRERAFARQVEAGVVPPDTVLTESPPWVAAWDDLSADEQRMHARGQEVFAGFLTHTDAQIGRFLDFLDKMGESENTIVVLLSDNGASAEGGKYGTFNEHRFSARLPETVEDNLAMADEWGGFHSYNHYSWGWAWAGNTPLRLWKRYTWLGGCRTPLIVRWPTGIEERGGTRSQFCHVVDLMPTLLDVCGIPQPSAVDGVPQDPFDGRSLVATFDDAGAPSPRTTQYFEMLGSRSIVHNGWKATTDHVLQGVVDEEELMTGSRDFATDHWGLFRLDDFSESDDVSSQHPEVVKALEEAWLVEAGKNHVFPLSEGLGSRIGALVMPEYPPAARRVFYPGAPVSDEVIPFLFGGFRIEADVSVPEGAEGVLCAFGDWNGGFALYARDSRLNFAFRPAGGLAETASESELPPGDHVLAVDCRPSEGGIEVALLCDGEVIAWTSSPVSIPFNFQHGGARLRLGFDTDFPVVNGYAPPFRWTGELRHVTVDASARPPAVSREEMIDALRND